MLQILGADGIDEGPPESLLGNPEFRESLLAETVPVGVVDLEGHLSL
jgi:hypothetical protein